MTPVLQRRFPRSTVLRIIVIFSLMLIGAYYVFSHTPVLNGVSLSIESSDRTDNYYAANLGADDHYNPRDFTHTIVATTSHRRLVKLRFPHRLRNAHDTIRFRFGIEPGVQRLDHFTFDNVLWLWNIPLVQWPIDELAKTIKPIQGISGIESTGGALTVVADGANPEFEIGLSLKNIEAGFDQQRVLMVRLMWVFWGGVVIGLLVFADKLIGSVFLLIKARKQHELYRPEGHFDRTKYWILAGIVLFIIANFARSWDNFTHPALYIEDAGHYFNLYYGGAEEFAKVFQKPNRYINFANNFVAWLTAEADVRVQPTLYLIFAITVGTITAIVLMFSGVFQNRWILLALPITLGLSGMNHIYYYNTLTFQMYTLIVLLLCLLLFPAPRSNLGWILMAVLLTVLIWSGPYSVLVVPFALVFILLFGEKRKNLLLFLLVVSTILYFLTVEEGTTNIAGLFSGERLHYVVSVLFSDILLLGLFGDVTFVKFLLLVVGLIALFYFLREDRTFVRISLVLWTITIAALAPYFMSIKYELFQYKPCHVLISYFFWLVFLLFAADRLLHRSKHKAALSPVVFLVFMTFVVVDNIQNPDKRFFPLMHDVSQFVETVYRYEQLNLAAKDQYVILKSNIGDKAWLGPGPSVIVGSRNPSARQLGPNDFQQTYSSPFVEKPAS